jgi:hypothetical protein
VSLVRPTTAAADRDAGEVVVRQNRTVLNALSDNGRPERARPRQRIEGG